MAPVIGKWSGHVSRVDADSVELAVRGNDGDPFGEVTFIIPKEQFKEKVSEPREGLCILLTLQGENLAFSPIADDIDDDMLSAAREG